MCKPYTFEAYYGVNAKPPHKKGDLAVASSWDDKNSRDIQVAFIESRPDIGLIIVLNKED